MASNPSATIADQIAQAANGCLAASAAVASVDAGAEQTTPKPSTTTGHPIANQRSANCSNSRSTVGRETIATDACPLLSSISSSSGTMSTVTSIGGGADAAPGSSATGNCSTTTNSSNGGHWEVVEYPVELNPFGDDDADDVGSSSSSPSPNSPPGSTEMEAKGGQRPKIGERGESSPPCSLPSSSTDDGTDGELLSMSPPPPARTTAAAAATATTTKWEQPAAATATAATTAFLLQEAAATESVDAGTTRSINALPALGAPNCKAPNQPQPPRPLLLPSPKPRERKQIPAAPAAEATNNRDNIASAPKQQQQHQHHHQQPVPASRRRSSLVVVDHYSNVQQQQQQNCRPVSTVAAPSSPAILLSPTNSQNTQKYNFASVSPGQMQTNLANSQHCRQVDVKMAKTGDVADDDDDSMNPFFCDDGVGSDDDGVVVSVTAAAGQAAETTTRRQSIFQTFHSNNDHPHQQQQQQQHMNPMQQQQQQQKVDHQQHYHRYEYIPAPFSTCEGTSVSAGCCPPGQQTATKTALPSSKPSFFFHNKQQERQQQQKYQSHQQQQQPCPKGSPFHDGEHSSAANISFPSSPVSLAGSPAASASLAAASAAATLAIINDLEAQLRRLDAQIDECEITGGRLEAQLLRAIGNTCAAPVPEQQAGWAVATSTLDPGPPSASAAVTVWGGLAPVPLLEPVPSETEESISSSMDRISMSTTAATDPGAALAPSEASPQQALATKTTAPETGPLEAGGGQMPTRTKAAAPKKEKKQQHKSSHQNSATLLGGGNTNTTNNSPQQQFGPVLDKYGEVLDRRCALLRTQSALVQRYMALFVDVAHTELDKRMKQQQQSRKMCRPSDDGVACTPGAHGCGSAPAASTDGATKMVGRPTNTVPASVVGNNNSAVAGGDTGGIDDALELELLVELLDIRNALLLPASKPPSSSAPSTGLITPPRTGKATIRIQNTPPPKAANMEQNAVALLSPPSNSSAFSLPTCSPLASPKTSSATGVVVASLLRLDKKAKKRLPAFLGGSGGGGGAITGKEENAARKEKEKRKLERTGKEKK